MTAIPVDFDVELLLTGWLTGRFPAAFVCTDTPKAMETLLPVIQVLRVGGRKIDRVLDFARIVIDTYGASRQSASDLARDVGRAVVWELPAAPVGAATVTAAVENSYPSRQYNPNPALHQFQGFYDLTIKPAY